MFRGVVYTIALTFQSISRRTCTFCQDCAFCLLFGFVLLGAFRDHDCVMFWVVHCRIRFCMVFLFVVCYYSGLLRFLLLWNVSFVNCLRWILIYSDELLTVISGRIPGL